jgi:hypothetical protein
MSKRRPKQASKTHKSPKVGAKSKKSLWRRPALWLGGLTTAVIAGVLVNFITAQSQHITHSSEPAIYPSGPATQSPDSKPSSGHKQLSAAAPAGPPLKVLSEDPLNLYQLVVWAFPREYLPDNDQLDDISSLIKSPIPASHSAFAEWFFSRGAYEIGGASTQLVVQNNRSYPIRIINMNVVKSCEAPLTGTLFFAAGGAVDATVGLGFNLDSPDTDAETARGTGPATWTPGYFNNYTISLEPGEQQVFDIYTATTRQACAYQLQVTVLDGEKQVYQLIGDGSEPFRVTAMPEGPNGPNFSAYKAMYVGGAAGPPNGMFIRVDPSNPFKS